MTSRNEFFYQTLKTNLTITGIEFLETYNIDNVKYPYIYLELGDESFDYTDYENGNINFKQGECGFELYYGTQIKNDKNINAKIRPEIFSKLDLLENKLRNIQTPIQFIYTENSIPIYECELTDIRILNNYKSYNDARVEIMISGIIKFTITYL